MPIRMSIQYIELDVEIRRLEEEISWHFDKVDELEDEIYRLDLERRRVNPTEDWFLEAQNYYNDAIQRLEDEVARLENDDRQLRDEVSRLYSFKSRGYSTITYSVLPKQHEFQNGGFGDPPTLAFGGQIEDYTSIQACSLASTEELLQNSSQALDASLRKVEECLMNSNKAMDRAMAKLKNMASTLTPPPAPRVGILGSTSGLKAPNQDSSKLIRPPSSSQALSSKSLALGGQEDQEIQLRGQNSEFRPLKIFEQQQGLNDTHQNDHGNCFRPEHDSQHLGVFQNLLDGKLFSGLEEIIEGFVLTQEEHDFRPERSQNIENPPMSQDQHILSSQGLSQVFEELPYSDSVLSSEQIMEASQE